jgi:hypothetical protein
MRNTIKHYVAISLVILTVGGFTGCQTAPRQEVTTEPEPVTTTERPVATQDEDVTVTERPVARHDEDVTMDEEVTTTDRPIARDAATAPSTLGEMQEGQPLSYYHRQFERLGYHIEDIEYQDGRITYDLRRGNVHQQVTLVQPQGQHRVQSVQVREVQETGAATGQRTGTRTN